MELIKVINKINEVGKIAFEVRKGHYERLSASEHDQVEQILLEAGAKPENEVTHLTSGEYYHHFNLDGHRFCVNFTKPKTKEEKIAELQKQIDELNKVE